MASSYFGFLIFCVSNILVSTCCNGQTSCQPINQTALFIFGGSIFDVGNNNYINTTTNSQANYYPYGETLRYPSGRFSDGRLIPDFIAEYAKLPLTVPYLLPGYHRYSDGVNFASAGAGALVETNKGEVIDLQSQLANFIKVSKLMRQELGNAETEELLSKAVYLFNFGANDYTAHLRSVSRSYTPQEYVDLVIGNHTTAITEIYKEGGRKFGFLGVAPLGCLPGIRAYSNASAPNSCLEKAQTLAKLHNKALPMALEKLERQLQGFKYSFTNFFDLVTELMNNPSKYGFKEGEVACCGSGPYRGGNTCGGKRASKEYELCENPNEYVFFDSIHPTERAHQIYAQQMWGGNCNFTAPYSIKSLFNFEFRGAVPKARLDKSDCLAYRSLKNTINK